MTHGEIVKVAGPLVVAKGLSDPQMYELVRVGDAQLFGEIIELRRDLIAKTDCKEWPILTVVRYLFIYVFKSHNNLLTINLIGFDWFVIFIIAINHILQQDTFKHFYSGFQVINRSFK